ncbi:short-chain dehydrogenase [Leptolyngbya sp. 'hensonii']|uniref:SDR family NAD(P)-dependent oxidoreductase n=1 Tax=Leptolyngbya sp. 'hensonii' TaxID=1922337 RepID=UPI00094FA5CE|nr:SDR family oxidoreductase [Leptolyngbya sp. 'hensonii']OLP15639.1 short-chain dehydrogenase [Leptolyngbya sp. 'hensonii']
MNFSQSRKTALVTGASGGIGADLAEVLAQNGYNLVLVARSRQKLLDLADQLRQKYGVAVRVLVMNLALPNAPTEIYSDLQQAGISIDLLVNNAGFGGYGPFVDTDLTTELEMLQVNLVALTHLSKLFLKGMVERRWGRILNVASTAAFLPGPLMAVYYASKAYVLSFSEALANEVAGTGVTVTVLCPGPTATGFEAKAHLEQSKLFKGQVMESRRVAIAGYRGLMAGQAIVIPGLSNQLGPLLARFLPRSLVRRLVRNAQERP